EGALVRVVADMPGADPATLQVRGAGTRLTIAATGPARRYERVLILPVPVRPEEAGSPPTFINGVMEVLLPAARPEPPAEDTRPAVVAPDANAETDLPDAPAALDPQPPADHAGLNGAGPDARQDEQEWSAGSHDRDDSATGPDAGGA
ncbi:MAG: hypothetical protein M3Q65_18030, partial [Chloroflexota bacterium]|nr:hypothetical protein [Chloroflexota bacterium]